MSSELRARPDTTMHDPRRFPDPMTPPYDCVAPAAPVRDRVQWGPILAGITTAIGVLLTVLGLAVGTSAFEPGSAAGDWGTSAGIWGGASVLVALFLGGWVPRDDAECVAEGAAYVALHRFGIDTA